MHPEGLYALITLAVTIGLQLFFFFIAYTCQFDKVTDIAGSMNFVILAWITFFLQGKYYIRQIVILAFVTTWGFRLGGFLLARVLSRGKDDRFDKLREHFFQFLGFWIFQILWVWIVSLPVIMVNAADVDVPLGSLDYAGFTLWVVGFLIESAADFGKKYFDSKPENRGKHVTGGVWNWSRHPNYFGEIILWLGIFLSSSSVYEANTRWAYFSIFSVIFTYFILVYGTGMPPAEQRSNKKWAGKPEWEAYKQRTSVLIPCPPGLFVHLPYCIKWSLFCEYGMYSTSPTSGISLLSNQQSKT